MAITAGCDVVEPSAALVIGAVAGIIFYISSIYLAEVLHVDDVVDAGAVHCFAGVWGCIAVGLFDSRDGMFYGGGSALLKSQCIGSFALVALSMGLIAPVAMLLKYLHFLRVSVETEAKGLDSHFGIKALVQETDKMLKLKATQDILANQGFDLADLIEALGAVREMAVATYSPGFETRNIEEMNSNSTEKLCFLKVKRFHNMSKKYKERVER